MAKKKPVQASDSQADDAPEDKSMLKMGTKILGNIGTQLIHGCVRDDNDASYLFLID